MNPKITDTTTDMTMPIAAARDALRVSSLMWADASYPVIVYWDIRRPMPNTTQYIGLAKLVPWNPEKFSVSVNTKLSDLWWSGTTIRTPTMTTTPAMCHQAEMLLICASMRTPYVLIRPWSTMITLYVTNVAAPKSIAAVTAIWPTRLNQPVNQPHPGLPSRDDQ